MGGDFRSWPHQRHIDGQPPDFNSSGAWTQPYLGLHSHLAMDPWHETIATNRSFSVSALAESPQPQIGYAEPHGWFYCLPNFRQSMFPPPDSFLKKQLPMEPQADSKKEATPDTSSQCPQKQFLVFDQTGDQTTMIFSSGVGTSPVHCLSSWTLNQATVSTYHPEKNEGRQEPMLDSSGTLLFDNLTDMNKFDEDHESDVQSEMHEDTEELNALMYSDSDSDSDDGEDEVTSTGHFPSTMTGSEKQYEFVEIEEEVGSSEEAPIKRQKLSHGGRVETEIDERIALNHGNFSFDEDTESHCGNGKVCDTEEFISLSGKKRTRKDLVRETVRTLQSIIPGGKGATPIEVIDEAINFLKSLKLKAASIGLDSM